MDIDLPDPISAETIEQAQPAVTSLRSLMADGALPEGLAPEAVAALLAIMGGVTEAASGDNADLSPSEAAERLKVARPTVMRLIGRGDLSSRKEGGHYVLTPREVRAYQARLAATRQEAFRTLTDMAEEFRY